MSCARCPTPFAQQHLKLLGPPNSGRSVAEWAPSLKRATDACVLASNNASPAQRGPRRDAQPLHATPLAAVLFPAPLRARAFYHPRQLGDLPERLHFVTIVAIGHLPPAASVGAECAGFSARCLRLVHGTALPQTLLRSRDVWGARTALESRDLAIGARAGAQWRGRRAGGSGGCERGRGSGAHRPAPGAAVTSKRGPGAARMTTHAALLRRR